MPVALSHVGCSHSITGHLANSYTDFIPHMNLHYDYTVDNTLPLMDVKLISAICHHPCFTPPTAS